MASDERRFSRVLGYEFRDRDLLKAALTHRSMGALNNERLEFLGDAILNAAVAIELFNRRPQASEGELSRLRAWLVREETLAIVARELQLGEMLRLGEGERKSGGRRRDSILADGLEAVVGAVYLDSDFAVTHGVVMHILGTRLDDLPALESLKDAKTRLQEYLQALQRPLPSYEVTASRGADHAREFTVRCRIEELDVEAEASASSRRRAEQHAARMCLDQLEEADSQ